jgi:hypothetical protein
VDNSGKLSGIELIEELVRVLFLGAHVHLLFYLCHQSAECPDCVFPEAGG